MLEEVAARYSQMFPGKDEEIVGFFWEVTASCAFPRSEGGGAPSSKTRPPKITCMRGREREDTSRVKVRGREGKRRGEEEEERMGTPKSREGQKTRLNGVSALQGNINCAIFDSSPPLLPALASLYRTATRLLDMQTTSVQLAWILQGVHCWTTFWTTRTLRGWLSLRHCLNYMANPLETTDRREPL